MQYPLSGVKVLDMSRVLAGPFAGRMLCDLGAEVVKVEPPARDVTRTLGRKVGTISGYFHQQNAGKQNISVDLSSTEGTALLTELVVSTDILIENFRPGVMERLGLDWSRLKQINPALIMLSISGFGQDGPEAKRAAYAPVIHAETGAISRQAERGGGRSVELCMSVADTNAGLHGLVGILAALHLRNSTGIGQHIDISMVDSMLATDDQTQNYLEDSENNTDGAEVWQATGGPIIIAADVRFLWRQLTAVFGLQDPVPADASLEVKISKRRQAIVDFLTSFESRSDLVRALDKANFAWGNVNRSQDYLKTSETLKHRRSIASVADGQGASRSVFQSPYRFSDALSGARGGASHLGEHNREVISRWTGRSEKEIQELTERGVLVSDV
tara:strand:- start:12734 stop:13894 length:1161 start_codon:yes stop_codon:yes gene_type:complete